MWADVKLTKREPSVWWPLTKDHDSVGNRLWLARQVLPGRLRPINTRHLATNDQLLAYLHISKRSRRSCSYWLPISQFADSDIFKVLPDENSPSDLILLIWFQAGTKVNFFGAIRHKGVSLGMQRNHRYSPPGLGSLASDALSGPQLTTIFIFIASQNQLPNLLPALPPPQVDDDGSHPQ